MLATPLSRSAQTIALIVALAFFVLSPTAQAGGGVNVDFGTKWGKPAGGYAAASGQLGVWNQAGLGVTGLVDVSGSPVGVSVNVVAASDGGFTGGGPLSDAPLLLEDNFFSLTGNTWSANVSGLADGIYLVYVYAPSSTSVPTGTMNVGGNALANLPGDAGSALIEGTSWARVPVSVSGGTLNISGSGAGLSGLAGLQILPFDPTGINVDFEAVGWGVPAAGYGAASGQVGNWNEAGPGVTNLVDLAGSPSGVSVNVQGSDSAVFPSPISDDELLQRDYIFVQGGAAWSASISGLADGAYLVFLYAPSDNVVPTGTMNVGGTVVAELPGDPGSVLIEGTSWAKVPVMVSGGTLNISGAGVNVSGLAGLQIVPFDPTGINVDFGTSFMRRVPAAGYGAASGQAGKWNLAGFGVTGLEDLVGSPSGVSVSVSAGSLNNIGGLLTDDQRLLGDSLMSVVGAGWSANVSGLADGAYMVFVYAPSNSSASTGPIDVGGTVVAELSGDPGSALIEGTSWAKVPVLVTGGTLNISGSGPGQTGLAGFQIVPLESRGLNVDFGTVYGIPASDYGAASGQVGNWNQAGLGITALVDLVGSASGASVSLVAAGDNGASGASPINDDQLLLQDNFLGLGGATWSVSVSGLADGAYLAFVYAPSNGVVATGTMNVGGTAVAELPGDLNSALIEGKSWARVPVLVSGGTLNISGSGANLSGLAGLQIVPVSLSSNYCTPGTSASGCNALISSTGLASASSAAGFTLNTTGVEGSKDGLYFFGTNGRQANSWGASTSFQCVVPPVKRAGLLSSVGTPGQCDGSFSQDLNALWNTQPAKNPGAGATVQAQLWYRDPFNTSAQTTSLSDAIEFTVGI